MRFCSIAGCNNKLRARGWCAAHWARWRKHGDPLITLMPTWGMGKDPVKRREAQQRYRESHREKLREAGRQYAAEHRAAAMEWKRRDKADDPEKYRQQDKRYRATHKEQQRKSASVCRRRNPELYRARICARRRRLGGIPERLQPGVWLAILAAYRNCCAYCGKQKRLEQDHVQPIHRGGQHTMHNIVPACRSCNASKGTRPPPKPVALVLL